MPITSTGAAFLTTAVAAGGWVVAYILKGWREDRTRRLEIELDHASAQMREFYAPLVALTDQLNTTAGVTALVTQGKPPEEAHELSGLIYSRFFVPLHDEINTILKTKVHLLEGRMIPRSFEDYFAHYSTERAYWTLTELGKDVSRVTVPGYPSSFYYDVRKGYSDVIARYEDTLKELRERRCLFGFGGLWSSHARHTVSACESRDRP